MTDEYDVELEEPAPIVSEAERRGWTREQAVEAGREAARLECVHLAARKPGIYTPQRVQERIETAGEYAAWEYDGRRARPAPAVPGVSAKQAAEAFAKIARASGVDSDWLKRRAGGKK